MSGPVQKTLQNGSEMNAKETIGAFCNGLRKSASCARELASLASDPSWVEIAKMLDAMRENGTKLSKMRAMSKIEVEHALNLKSMPGNANLQIN